jgi:hypothetical protein
LTKNLNCNRLIERMTLLCLLFLFSHSQTNDCKPVRKHGIVCKISQFRRKFCQHWNNYEWISLGVCGMFLDVVGCSTDVLGVTAQYVELGFQLRLLQRTVDSSHGFVRWW